MRAALLVPSALLLLLLLSCLTSPVRASVDVSFGECSHFLYRQKAPVGMKAVGLRSICQRYEGKPRYATLYDPAHRIPLYSAYIFKGSNGVKMAIYPWMYEPQLYRASETGNMQPFLHTGAHQHLEDTQAVLADYTDAAPYVRGQLTPDQHQRSPGAKAATYTLTNVVPMTKEFLHNQWEPHLDAIRQRLNNHCPGTAYVLTGVTTSGLTLRRGSARRVTVPKYVWSAYCCPDFDPGVPYDIRYKFPSYAAYGLNEVFESSLSEVSVQTLQAQMRRETPVDRHFQLFDRNCISEV